jgi:hypothetical protein
VEFPAAAKEDFVTHLLLLEQQLSSYRTIHQEELEKLQEALEQLKQEFLSLMQLVNELRTVEERRSESQEGHPLTSVIRELGS